MTQENQDTFNLAAAAQELIKAASAHAESTSLGVKALEQLSRESATIHQSIDSSNAKADATLKAIENLTNEIVSLKDAMISRDKRQGLEWVITFNTKWPGSFRNYWPVMKEILDKFRMGADRAKVGYSCMTYNESYANTILKEICGVTGMNHRMEFVDGAYWIYYS